MKIKDKIHRVGAGVLSALILVGSMVGGLSACQQSETLRDPDSESSVAESSMDVSVEATDTTTKPSVSETTTSSSTTAKTTVSTTTTTKGTTKGTNKTTTKTTTKATTKPTTKTTTKATTKQDTSKTYPMERPDDAASRLPAITVMVMNEWTEAEYKAQIEKAKKYTCPDCGKHDCRSLNYYYDTDGNPYDWGWSEKKCPVYMSVDHYCGYCGKLIASFDDMHMYPDKFPSDKYCDGGCKTFG